GPVYEIEPYVMPGDVYGAAPYVGRGGWSWYTGSAAWLYRAATETLLGLDVRGDQLSLTPRIPASWPGFEISLALEGRRITLRCSREATHDEAVQLEAGEWVEWKSLASGTTLQVRLLH
ncbi:MAG: hypothetical protein EOP77_06100, partial [Variovorax sp.]